MIDLELKYFAEPGSSLNAENVCGVDGQAHWWRKQP